MFIFVTSHSLDGMSNESDFELCYEIIFDSISCLVINIKHLHFPSRLVDLLSMVSIIGIQDILKSINFITTYLTRR